MYNVKKNAITSNDKGVEMVVNVTGDNGTSLAFSRAMRRLGIIFPGNVS
jgi:hypothetical protein